MTEQSEEMMVLLKELAILKDSKKKSADLQRRKAEIKRQMKELADQAKRSSSE